MHILVTRAIGLVFLSCFINLGLIGQQLAGSFTPNLEEYPFFNAEFIAQSKIKTLQTQVMYKMPNRPIRKTQEQQKFEFGSLGHIDKYVRLSSDGVRFKEAYFLNRGNRLATIHLQFAKRNELCSFTYNEDHLVTKKEVANTNDAVLISEENFKYERFSESQYKKFYLNDEGLTYRYEVVDLDEKGRVVETRARYIHGMNRLSKQWVYKDDLLLSYVTNLRELTRREEKYLMEYDVNKVLQVTNFWVDAALIYRYEYLYEKGLLVAVLRKDMNSQEIKITKLKYTFY